MSAFGKAFAAARKAGQKTFMWNGKSFHTRTAEEEAGKKNPARAAASTKPTALPKPAGKETWAGTVEAPKGFSAADRAREGQRDRFRQRNAQQKSFINSVNNPQRLAKGGAVRGGGCAKRGRGKGRMV